MCLEASLVPAAENGGPFVGMGSGNEGQGVGKRAILRAQHPVPSPAGKCFFSMMPNPSIESRSAEPAADVLAVAGGNLRSELRAPCKGNALSCR